MTAGTAEAVVPGDATRSARDALILNFSPLVKYVAGRVAVGRQHMACADEVFVAIVPIAHALDGKMEYFRGEPGTPG